MSFRIKPASNALKADEPGPQSRSGRSIMSFLRADCEVPNQRPTPTSTNQSSQPSKPNKGSDYGLSVRIGSSAHVDSM